MAHLHRRPISELLTDAVDQLVLADPADTPVALYALWHGFCVAAALGRVLAAGGDPAEYPPRWYRAQPVLVAAIGALCRAPSLPTELAVTINLAGSADDRLAEATVLRLHAGVHVLASAIATLAAVSARHAVGADARACRDATVLADELRGCYAVRPCALPGASSC